MTPLDLEEFKEDIDIHGGYLQNLSKSTDCFSRELERAKNECLNEQKMMQKYLRDSKTIVTAVMQYTKSLLVLKDNRETVQKYREKSL